VIPCMKHILLFLGRYIRRVYICLKS
jgi:hypothetical protein